MTIRSFLVTLTLLVGFATTHAQEIVTGTVDTSHADFPDTAMAPPKESAAPGTRSEAPRNVWKRKKYFYLSYGIQKQKSLSTTTNSDMAFALIKGRTYYLHKKPIARMLKFGIDWNQFDLNFAKFPDLPTSSSNKEDGDLKLPDLGSMQIEAGMGVGPSITVNPVNHLKVALYFHVTPSYSLILQNSELYHHYATFFNVGLTASYKVISIGIENRWSGKTNYGGVSMSRANELYDEQGNFIDPFLSVGSKISNQTFRIFVGIRF